MIQRFRPLFAAAAALSSLFLCSLYTIAQAETALNLSTQANASSAQADPIFDVPALLATPLNSHTLKVTEEDGIVTEEVMFHSEMDGEKSVDIFAYFSYLKDAKNLPAFIWNQAGAARASTYFTVLGAKRGYAAMCIDLPITSYRSTGSYPINTGLEVGDDPRKAPIYHGAVALLKAVSYLQSRAEVDKERVGMAGSSWGGFFTTLMAGIDPRLKAASAMFGTGSLQLGNAWWDARAPEGKYDAAYRERWRTTLDPAWRLPQSKVPIAWFSGTNDGFYWMPALMQSYSLAAEPKHLTLLPNYDHGLTPILDEQVFVWLDAHLKGAPSFVQVSPLQLEKQGKNLFATWNYDGLRKVVSADLILSYGENNWSRRYWSTLAVKPKDGLCRVKLPRSTLPFYISGSATDENGFRYSTPLLCVEPAQFDKESKPAMIEYNGASLWDGFEEPQIQFLKAIGWPAPPVSTEARDRKQSALLKAGKTALPTILFTPGVKHRFVCYLKARAPVTVGLEIGGRFDGEVKSEQKQFEVGTQWTKIEMEYTPPAARVGELGATFTVPADAEVFCDSVGFFPVWNTK